MKTVSYIVAIFREVKIKKKINSDVNASKQQNYECVLGWFTSRKMSDETGL